MSDTTTKPTVGVEAGAGTGAAAAQPKPSPTFPDFMQELDDYIDATETISPEEFQRFLLSIPESPPDEEKKRVTTTEPLRPVITASTHMIAADEFYCFTRDIFYGENSSREITRLRANNSLAYLKQEFVKLGAKLREMDAAKPDLELIKATATTLYKLAIVEKLLQHKDAGIHMLEATTLAKECYFLQGILTSKREISDIKDSKELWQIITDENLYADPVFKKIQIPRMMKFLQPFKGNEQKKLETSMVSHKAEAFQMIELILNRLETYQTQSTNGIDCLFNLDNSKDKELCFCLKNKEDSYPPIKALIQSFCNLLLTGEHYRNHSQFEFPTERSIFAHILQDLGFAEPCDNLPLISYYDGKEDRLLIDGHSSKYYDRAKIESAVKNNREKLLAKYGDFKLTMLSNGSDLKNCYICVKKLNDLHLPKTVEQRRSEAEQRTYEEDAFEERQAPKP